MSAQHDDGVDQEKIQNDLVELVVKPVIGPEGVEGGTKQ